MDQMEMLWQFMQDDLKADRLAAALKHSAARENAEKARDAYFAQKKAADQLTEQANSQADRMDTVKDAVAHYADQLTALSKRLSENPPTELEEIRSLMSEIERCRKSLQDFEAELKRMTAQGKTMAERMNTIGAAAAAAKRDFDKYKKEMEAEMAKDSSGKKEELEKLRASAKAIGAQVPQNLMNEYLSIKKHIMPPLARLVGGACSGCNTSQPSALLARINAGNDIVECETCGRMLIK